MKRMIALVIICSSVASAQTMTGGSVTGVSLSAVGGGGGGFPDANGVEARVTAINSGGDWACSEPLNGPETANGGVISHNFDPVSSDNSTECWRVGGTAELVGATDSGGNQTVVSLTGWGSADYAVDQDGGFMWWYGRKVSSLTGSHQTICWRYYKQVDSNYGSTGGDAGNPNGACPNTTWRNKMFQTQIGAYQTQLEEFNSTNCPALGTWNNFALGPDSGPDEGNYGFTPAVDYSSCVDAPCRIEFCVEGDLTAGTAIVQRARVHSIDTGTTHTVTRPSVNYGGGMNNNFLNGGDLFHSGPNTSRLGFFANAVWDTAGEWIGCAEEVEGSGC